jgi:hypothetical protein
MQGSILFLLGIIIVPILAIMASFAPDVGEVFGFFAAVSASICFVGGPLRMLFAAVFEQGAPKYPQFSQTSFPPPAIQPRAFSLCRLRQSIRPASGVGPTRLKSSRRERH